MHTKDTNLSGRKKAGCVEVVWQSDKELFIQILILFSASPPFILVHYYFLIKVFPVGAEMRFVRFPC